MKLTRRGDGLLIDILVTPRAAKERVGPLKEDRLKVCVTAPPVDDAANDAVIELLAKTLGCKKRDIEIVRGSTSRKKTLCIRGVSEATLLELCS